MILDENGRYTAPSGKSYIYDEKAKTNMREWRKDNLDKVDLRLPKGFKASLKEVVPSSDKSMIGYISRLIYEDIDRRVSSGDISTEDMKKMVNAYEKEIKELFSKKPELRESFEECSQIKKIREHIE